MPGWKLPVAVGCRSPRRELLVIDGKIHVEGDAGVLDDQGA